MKRFGREACMRLRLRKELSMDSGQHASKGRSGFFNLFISFLIMVAIILTAVLALRSYIVVPYEIPSDRWKPRS